MKSRDLLVQMAYSQYWGARVSDVTVELKTFSAKTIDHLSGVG